MSLAISLTALTVSIITLWLTQLRGGRLVATPPKSWAGTILDSRAIIMLPLAIANTGARAKVIRDLRLVFLDEPNAEPFAWVRTRPELRPEIGDPSFSAPFVIDGQAAILQFVEFQRAPGRTPEAGTWQVRIDVQLLDDPERWKVLLQFDWGVAQAGVPNLNAFIAHENAPRVDEPSSSLGPATPLQA